MEPPSDAPNNNNGKPIRVALFTVMGFSIHTLVKVVDERPDTELAVVFTCTGPTSRRSNAHMEVLQALWDTQHYNVDVVVSNKRTKYADLCALYQVDLIASVGYPWLLPADLLSDPRIPYGAINFHNSELPQLRGPNSFGWAIVNGDTTLHFCAHRMEAQFDTGPVLVRKQMPLDINEDIDSLFTRMPPLMIEMIHEAMDLVKQGAPGEPQTGEASHAPKFADEFRSIDWKDTALNIHNKVRAFYGARDIPKGALAKNIKVGDNDDQAEGTICIVQTRVDLDKSTATPQSADPPGTVSNWNPVGSTFDVQCGDQVLHVLKWHRVEE